MARRPTSAWITAAERVSNAPTDNFVELIRIANLDPRRDLRFADLSGISFAGCELRGFDFTGARMIGCDFSGALLQGARFDQAEIDQSRPYVHLDSARTNFSRAKDWAPNAPGWRRATHISSDDHLPAGAVFQDAPFAPEMVAMPAGSFMMGTSLKEMEAIKQRHGEFYGEWLKLESPLHPVVIAKPFAMGRFAVTFDEWEVFARITGRKMPDDERWGRGRRPVINVSWNDASAYVEWLGETTGRPYRLPTEAEWEYGCRAGTTTAYSIGATITREQALFSPGYDSAEDRTVVVGTFRCNGWGLFDMHGNVWEWCQDQWHHNYDGAPDNGLAWQEKSKGGRRVVRGGAWSSKPENLRAANRDGDLAVDFSSSLGIRVARSLTS